MNGDADCGNHRNECKREEMKNKMRHKMNERLVWKETRRERKMNERTE